VESLESVPLPISLYIQHVFAAHRDALVLVWRKYWSWHRRGDIPLWFILTLTGYRVGQQRQPIYVLHLIELIRGRCPQVWRAPSELIKAADELPPA
jgi:hypothetical protein